MQRVEGKFDYVVMNPPFGAVVDEHIPHIESGAKLSQHLFLELAVRALKPEGIALVIGPYNLINRIPKKARTWFDRNMVLEQEYPQLSGKFKQTNIMVSAFYIRSIREPVLKKVPVLIKTVEKYMQMELF